MDPAIPSLSNGLVPLVHVNPTFDCQVCSSPLPVSGCHSREGRGGANWTAGEDYNLQRLRPRVLLAASFDLIIAACTADSDVRRFSWPSLSEIPICWFNSGLTPSGPSLAACWLQVLTAAAAFWSCIMTLGQCRLRQFAYRGRGALCVVWWGLVWLGWVVDFHPEFC